MGWSKIARKKQNLTILVLLEYNRFSRGHHIQFVGTISRVPFKYNAFQMTFI